MVTLWPNKPVVSRLTASRGQSIVEVLIAVAVVAVVLTTVAAGLTYSVKTTSEARYRAFATNYAQDAIEVFRRERATLGWELFRDNIEAGTTCLNTLPATTDAFINLTPAACTVGVPMLGMDFRREVVVTFLSPDEIQVEAVVSWTDGNRSPEISVVQQFRAY